jgi:phosphatidylserine/phosphatidylglycerophosphate/cardiolipin synthase-like enzyme/uncharacterized membrane protein YdjX (TVP38/TMEM64 family)
MHPFSKLIADEGRNCWRREHAGRVSFLIDAQAYFSAFVSAVEQAEQSIFILGWDIDSRLNLNPEHDAGPYPGMLGNFLNKIVRAKRELNVYILSWDFSMIYLFERELMPIFKLDWRTHSRIHFRLDSYHPPGGSHHQKIVVIDDALAFSGGMDLTGRRWDTPEHKLDDPRRIDPWGAPYHPFHDVQIAVDGDAASALGWLARERWHRVTGKFPEMHQRKNRPWPVDLNPDMTDVEVMISRTYNDGENEIKEVASLFLDMIGAAQAKMYIENPYITTPKIGEALGKRLQEEDGPEMAIIIPKQCSGWLEQSTMGVYRARILRELHSLDRYGKMKIYCPNHPEIEIHSKVFIIDDDIVRIGSANLTNRSMNLDTECDLTIEAAGELRIREAISAFRNRLLGEHLGVKPESVAETESEEKSLGRTVEKLRLLTGKLEVYSEEIEEDKEPLCDDIFCDPEKPVDANEVMQYMVPDDFQEPSRGRLMSTIALLAALGAITAAWHWTPLRDWVQPDAIAAMMIPIRYSIMAPLMVVSAYAVFGLVIPITFMVISTVLVFDPLPGFCYALIGCLTSASVSYAVGKILGRDLICKLAGSKLNRISKHIIRHGFLAITFLRIAAVAPFTVINLIAGATRIKYHHYILGTISGMLPGLIALTFFGDRMGAAIRHPDIKSLSVLMILIVLFMIVSIWLSRKIGNPAKARS